MNIERGAASPALAAAVVFGLSGAGFVFANLVLARTMVPHDYAIVSLIVALIQIAMPLGPWGLDTLVARRQFAASQDLLRRSLVTSAASGAVAVLLGALLYHLEPVLLALLLVACVAGGANLVASSVHQGARRFAPALALSQNQNAFLAVGAAATVLLPVRKPWIPCAVYAAGYVISATWGWWHLLRAHRGNGQRPTIGVAEMLSLAGLTAVTLILIQAERLVIPRRLSLDDLALFGVLAAVAASPYRVLQQGVGYTLLPRLRAAANVAERRKLIAHEARVGLLVTLLASITIWIVTPPLVRWWLHGRYVITYELLFVAILAGFAKIFAAFGTAAAAALCTESELARVRGQSWWVLVGSFVACAFAARWGLVGVVAGAGLGWLAFGLAAGSAAKRHLQKSLAPEVVAASAELRP